MMTETFKCLSPKPGDVLRFTASHPLRGTEIMVPSANAAIVKGCPDDINVSVGMINNGDEISFFVFGQVYGDADMWERVA